MAAVAISGVILHTVFPCSNSTGRWWRLSLQSLCTILLGFLAAISADGHNLYTVDENKEVPDSVCFYYHYCYYYYQYYYMPVMLRLVKWNCLISISGCSNGQTVKFHFFMLERLLTWPDSVGRTLKSNHSLLTNYLTYLLVPFIGVCV